MEQKRNIPVTIWRSGYFTVQPLHRRPFALVNGRRARDARSCSGSGWRDRSGYYDLTPRRRLRARGRLVKTGRASVIKWRTPAVDFQSTRRPR
jgi:hypothetical protein